MRALGLTDYKQEYLLLLLITLKSDLLKALLKNIILLKIFLKILLKALYPNCRRRQPFTYNIRKT